MHVGWGLALRDGEDVPLAVAVAVAVVFEVVFVVPFPLSAP
jgi:hypothetical protein